MGTTGKVKSRWTRSFFTALNTRGDEERYSCDICQKGFANLSNLTLHSQVHVIERKFKCEPCQVSFHSQGHLQKHKRSSSHETRVQMTQAFGVPTSDNPRPYGCSECDTAFRKHGHLAKHLRSKSHITRLESRGLIPSGTYAALEKCGQDLKDRLVTTNYEQSLISMREIAMQLFQQQVMVNDPQPSYSTLEPLGGGVDNPDLMASYPSTSLSAQPQPIMGSTYFSSTSTPPHHHIQHVSPDLMSLSGPSIMLQPQQPHQHAHTHAHPHPHLHPHQHPHPHPHPHSHPPPPQLSHHQQHHQAISSPQPIFQQHHQINPEIYMNESTSPQMMVSNMMPPQHQQVHSIDYTLSGHHYQH